VKVDERVQAILARRATGDNSPLTEQEWQALSELVMRRNERGLTTKIMFLMGLENYQMLRGFRKGFKIGQLVAGIGATQ
jgi:hypothetical protein